MPKNTTTSFMGVKGPFRSVATVMDIAVGVCFCHPAPVPWVGIVVPAGDNVYINGNEVACVGDLVVGCHSAVIITGNNRVTVNNKKLARIGDLCEGCPSGILVEGPRNVITN